MKIVSLIKYDYDTDVKNKATLPKSRFLQVKLETHLNKMIEKLQCNPNTLHHIYIHRTHCNHDNHHCHDDYNHFHHQNHLRQIPGLMSQNRNVHTDLRIPKKTKFNEAANF